MQRLRERMRSAELKYLKDLTIKFAHKGIWAAAIAAGIGRNQLYTLFERNRLDISVLRKTPDAINESSKTD